MLHRIAAATAGILLLLAGPVAALDPPKSDPLLTVTGLIDVTNAGDGAVFDRDLLRGLDWREIETHTSFTDGPQSFAGPTLASLLDAVGATGDTLLATAINDYRVAIPVTDADRYDVLLAMEHNGAPMRVRNKGPVWVIYPLSAEEAYAKPFDAKMIWQLVRVEVTD